MSQASPLPPTGKTVDQLQEEFRILNEHAMEIQAKLAAIAGQLAARNIKVVKPKPPGSDTVKI